MKLKALKFKGIGRPFKDEVEIDFDSLGPGLIALQGENGNGKSTVLELSGPGSLYREFVSYGDSLADHVNPAARDAFSELTFDIGGAEYKALVQSDPMFNGGRGRNEAYLTQDGTPIAGPGVREFDAALGKILPDRDFFCASPFAAQGGEGSFWRMAKAQRKTMLMQMLGLGRYQAKSEKSEEFSKGWRDKQAPLADREADLLGKIELHKLLSGKLEARLKELAELVSQYETASQSNDAEIADYEQRKQEAQAELKMLESELSDCKQKLATEKAQLVTLQKTMLDVLAPQLMEARKAAEKLQQLGDLDKELADAMGAQQKSADQLAEAQARAESLRLPAEEEATRLKEMDRLLNQLATLRPATKIEGVDLSRDICVTCPLTDRALLARKQVEGLEVELAKFDGVPTTPVLGQQYAQAAKDQNAAQAALTTAMGAVARAQSAVHAAMEYRLQAGKCGAIEEALGKANEAFDNCKIRIESHTSQVAKQAAQVDSAKTAIEAIQADLDKLRAGSREQENIAKQIQSTQQSIAGFRGQLEMLGTPDHDLANVHAELRQVRGEMESWNLLAKGFGRDGIQALEIDAAGPGITTIANELLASCYGPRFALAIETLATKKDGGQKEVFDIRIIDGEAGCDILRGSGGEMVIIEESLRLALAIYNAKVSGYELRTLWRDETAGALSPGNAVRYIAMLRKAMELGGFHQVIFVAHSPEVWQLADAVLHVANGTVTKG